MSGRDAEVPYLAIVSPEDGGGMSIPYAWDAACRECEMLLGRFEYEFPRYLEGAWRPLASYRRTMIAPELSQLAGLDPDLALPRFGLRQKARRGGGQPSRQHVSWRAFHEVRGEVVAYCPRRGCERRHLLAPPSQYGPTPDGPEWSAFINPYSGEDLLARRDPRLEAFLRAHARRIPEQRRVRPTPPGAQWR